MISLKLWKKPELHYSKKNILILSEANDKLKLKEKIEHEIECTIWEGFLNISPNEQNIQQTYSLKTLKSLRNGFIQTRLIEISQSSKSKISSDFQNLYFQKLFIFEDETSNIYQLQKDEYNKLTTTTLGHKKVLETLATK